MIDSSNPNQSNLYLDFAQFNDLRKMSREDQDQALRQTAKQMEGVFLNMMLQSMRDANSVFAEGNMMESRDTQFYRGMYDKQLASNISDMGGVGLADIIVRQMSRQQNQLDEDNVVARSYDISAYLKSPLTTRLRTEAEAASGVDQVSATGDSRSAATNNSVSNAATAVQPVLPVRNPQSPDQITWETPEQFIEAILPFAEKAGRDLSVEPEAIVAQAILETGWGKHVMQDGQGGTSYNFFGIKADTRWDGDVTRKNTLEYRNGIAAREVAAFRSYGSLGQAFDDYVSFLKTNARYESVANQKTESKQWGFELQQCGYATDPEYGKKIAGIMESDVFQSTMTRLRQSI